jgi:hypothetical protein
LVSKRLRTQVTEALRKDFKYSTLIT